MKCDSRRADLRQQATEREGQARTDLVSDLRDTMDMRELATSRHDISYKTG